MRAIEQGYLAACGVIDFHHPEVMAKADELSVEGNPLATIVSCFNFVRDEIDHSMDVAASRVCCRASEVLRFGHGLCYAKSHLLTALLRANAVPSGLDYQRLADGRWGYVLHGVSTLWLEPHGWLWLDGRGGEVGEAVEFVPERSMMVFASDSSGELDYRLNLERPLPELVTLLQSESDLRAVVARLPSGVVMG